MFTGIVQSLRPVKAVIPLPGRLRYAVDLGAALTNHLQAGASVAIDGVCQTATTIEGTLVWFDAIDETLKKTTLKNLTPGQLVNIERAARFGDEIGGHLLSGHVYGVAEIADIQRPQGNCIITLQCPPIWTRYLFEKGFVALDGASLTLVDIAAAGTFTVHLIPETLQRTTLGTKDVGALVNVEIDAHTQAIVDTVERIMKNRPNT